jgi:hypothetical protein
MAARRYRSGVSYTGITTEISGGSTSRPIASPIARRSSLVIVSYRLIQAA